MITFVSSPLIFIYHLISLIICIAFGITFITFIAMVIYYIVKDNKKEKDGDRNQKNKKLGNYQ